LVTKSGTSIHQRRTFETQQSQPIPSPKPFYARHPHIDNNHHLPLSPPRITVTSHVQGSLDSSIPFPKIISRGRHFDNNPAVTTTWKAGDFSIGIIFSSYIREFHVGSDKQVADRYLLKLWTPSWGSLRRPPPPQQATSNISQQSNRARFLILEHKQAAGYRPGRNSDIARPSRYISNTTTIAQ
jgi:hypothetical protein